MDQIYAISTCIETNLLRINGFYLDQYIYCNNKNRIYQREKKPDLHRLDISSIGQAGGDRKVDGGKDHHAGYVNSDDHLVPLN